MAVLIDRLERAAGEIPELRLQLRSFTRELEALEKVLEQLERRVSTHVTAGGHGDPPVVIDESAMTAIATHLADEARHAQRRRSIYRVLGAGTGQLFDLGLRIVTTIVLGYVAARMGGLQLPGQ